MVDAEIAVRPSLPIPNRRLLSYSMYAVVGLHAVLLIVARPHPLVASRLLTAIVPVLSAICAFVRAPLVAPRERPAWRWGGVAMLLWALGHTVETFVGHTTTVTNLAADPSDFIYIAGTFPLLLALSASRETKSIQTVFLLNCAQIGLAFVLTYVRLYQMTMPAATAATVMGRIYGIVCILMATLTALRMFTWATLEERRCVRWICIFIWTYTVIELGMNYATEYWHLQAGTLLDLLWSFPFVLCGRQTVYLPTEELPPGPPKKLSRFQLVVESLCPMLVTTAVFALAASITSQHAQLALTAIFLLLLIQGVVAGVVQSNYLTGQNLLLERERELQDANVALEQLSLLDPLTGIPNRRRFTAALDDAWRRAMRRQEPIAILMIDVDHFKGVNDRHGHTYGDECLVAIAQALGQHAGRADDLLARYGGEEFVLLLPEMDQASAVAVAERMHRAVHRLEIANNGSPFGSMLTVSIGVGTGLPRFDLHPATLIEVADQALYDAKRQGRNRIRIRALEEASTLQG